MSLHVHVLQALEPEARRTLEDALEACGGGVLSEGPTEPGASYRILIGGRPSHDDLVHSPDLELLLIPFAGLPQSTCALLADFPALRVHNLHHNAVATAEGALGLLLAAARHTIPADQALRRGDWHMRYVQASESPSRILAEKTALVLGYGAIGQRVARLLRAFEVAVHAIRRSPRPGDPPWVYPQSELDRQIPEAEVLVVCLPETDATRGLLDRDRLAALPKGALLVNVGRGAVIEEEALFHALRDGHLGGAGIDVWYTYPADEAARSDTQPSRFPFHELDNVVLSPHRIAHGDRNEPLRWRAIADFLAAFATGSPLPHRVDLARGY